MTHQMCETAMLLVKYAAINSIDLGRRASTPFPTQGEERFTIEVLVWDLWFQRLVHEQTIARLEAGTKTLNAENERLTDRLIAQDDEIRHWKDRNEDLTMEIREISEFAG